MIDTPQALKDRHSVKRLAEKHNAYKGRMLNNGWAEREIDLKKRIVLKGEAIELLHSYGNPEAFLHSLLRPENICKPYKFVLAIPKEGDMFNNNNHINTIVSNFVFYSVFEQERRIGDKGDVSVKKVTANDLYSKTRYNDKSPWVSRNFITEVKDPHILVIDGMELLCGNEHTAHSVDDILRSRVGKTTVITFTQNPETEMMALKEVMRTKIAERLGSVMGKIYGDILASSPLSTLDDREKFSRERVIIDIK